MTADDWQAFGSLAALGISIAVAVIGWKHAINANRATREANATAEQALELARSTEARAQRLEDRAIERRDVRWEVAKRADVGDRLAITNIGTDSAHHVVLAVHPEGQARRQTRADKVSPDGRIDVDVEDLAQQKRTRAAQAGPNVFLGTAITVQASVAWESASGVPDSCDFGRLHI